MILSDVSSLSTAPTIVDIGCGSGFDGERSGFEGEQNLQERIIQNAGQYIGVDPDAAEGPEYVRTIFEEAPLHPNSVDLAFSVMVLEHIADPLRFWNKLHSILRVGGVFWGFTIDGRHWFRHVSAWTERLRIKDLYLNLLLGKRGIDRYANYPTHYRTNSPTQIRTLTKAFRSVELINFQRLGQLDCYVPKLLRPVARAIDRLEIALGRPGVILGIRALK